MFYRLRTTLLLLVAMVNLSGCTYMQQRANDAKDIMDIGLTFSSKPQFAAYYSGPFVQIAAIGAGKVDGHFFGMGEGRLATWAPHYEESLGLIVWGEERLSFYHTKAELDAMEEKERDKASNFMRVGLAGLIQGPPPSLKYIGSCPHYLHLGWVGVVATPRFLQMLDFLLGWTTLDICQDDGRALAKTEKKE